jgi:hypothetical protein
LEDYSKLSVDFKPMQWIQEALKALDEHLQKYSTPAGLDYEELGGLSDPGQQDCSRAWNILE